LFKNVEIRSTLTVIQIHRKRVLMSFYMYFSNVFINKNALTNAAA